MQTVDVFASITKGPELAAVCVMTRQKGACGVALFSPRRYTIIKAAASPEHTQR